MSVLDKIFGGTKKESVAVEVPPCPHTTLTPRWDSVDDMGKEELATNYICEGCHESFTPDQVRELQETPLTERIDFQRPEEVA